MVAIILRTWRTSRFFAHEVCHLKPTAFHIGHVEINGLKKTISGIGDQFKLNLKEIFDNRSCFNAEPINVQTKKFFRF